MRAAQVAFSVLIGVFVAAGTVLFISDDPVPAWACLGVAWFGFVLLMGMIATDRAGTPPPGP